MEFKNNFIRAIAVIGILTLVTLTVLPGCNFIGQANPDDSGTTDAMGGDVIAQGCPICLSTDIAGPDVDGYITCNACNHKWLQNDIADDVIIDDSTPTNQGGVSNGGSSNGGSSNGGSYNGGSSNGGSSNGGSYKPNGGSNPGGTSNGGSFVPETTTKSSDQVLKDYLEDLKASADRFSESITIKEDDEYISVESVDGTDTGLFGFKYSKKDKCFVTAENAWQRNFGYNEVYDASAPVIAITYDTMRVKFNYGGLEWMIQYWKGQYGMVMIGAEIGVYNRPENAVEGTHYECADDETKLLQSMTVYRRESSTSNNFKPIFTRSMSNTWWCTGFIPGTLGAGRYNVTAEETAGLKVDSKIVLKTPEMAQAFIQGLKEVDLIYHNAPQSTRGVSFKEAATAEEYEKLNNKAMFFLEEDGVTVRVCWR